jgi:hypothetical protein
MELEFSVSVEALPKRLRQWAAMLVNIETKRPAVNKLCAELDEKVSICEIHLPQRHSDNA